MIKAFYEKHETGIKIFAGLALLALVVTILLFGSADYNLNQ